MRKVLLVILVSIPLLCLCLGSLFFLPPVHERVAPRFDELRLRLLYILYPPQKKVFMPLEQAIKTAMPSPLSPTQPLPSPSPSAPRAMALAASPTEPGPTATLAPTQAPAPSDTPLPKRVELKGVVYQDQRVAQNYCAPANLAMALTYWGWKGDEFVVGPVIKPDKKDKNVMPYEMAAYVQERTDLGAVTRVGGNLDLLKRFLAAGFPVLIEKGVYFHDLTGVVSWMGHYQVLTGYDETGQYFIAQDSFIKPDYQVPYNTMIEGWRAFNYIYLVIYPKEKEPLVMGLLGVEADEKINYQNAAKKASDEIYSLSGIDQYFAWYNRGTNLVQLQDYAGAAEAYDESFKIYPTIPEAKRPWRMLWYQTGPYWAYFYTQRYYDVLYLADGTLNAMQSDRNLEESYYWRGMAKAALGDTAGAIQDYRTALKYHPNFEPAIYQLNLLGAAP